MSVHFSPNQVATVGDASVFEGVTILYNYEDTYFITRLRGESLNEKRNVTQNIDSRKLFLGSRESLGLACHVGEKIK